MTKKIKYPRTFHLPWSLTINSDDRVLNSLDSFSGQEIIVTEKMDGENTSIYNFGYHARSLDSKYHESREWLSRFVSEIAFKIPDGMRICGENLYAKHSILYKNLTSYFYAFSVWENDVCLSWEDSTLILKELGIDTVPVLYQGIFSVDLLKSLSENLDLDACEGYVVRLAKQFKLENFKDSVGKFVRSKHVQTDKHWMTSKIERNILA